MPSPASLSTKDVDVMAGAVAAISRPGGDSEDGWHSVRIVKRTEGTRDIKNITEFQHSHEPPIQPPWEDRLYYSVTANTVPN